MKNSSPKTISSASGFSPSTRSERNGSNREKYAGQIREVLFNACRKTMYHAVAYIGLDKMYIYQGFAIYTYPDDKAVDHVLQVVLTDDTLSTPEGLIIELTGNHDKVDAFLSLLEGYEILELARTGIAGLRRGTDDIVYLDLDNE